MNVLRQLSRRWKELCLSVSALVLGLAVIDRALCLRYPAFKIDGSILVPDEDLGWKIRPNLVVPRQGLRTNRDGFRGEAFSAGEKRPVAVFIGDSVTYGATTDDSTFPALFEEASGWRAYNRGVPSYGPLQYEKLLRRVTVVAAKAIVIGFFVGNDVSDCRENRKVHLQGEEGISSPWSWSGIYRFLLFRRLVSWPALDEAIAATRESAWDQRSPTRTHEQFTELELERLAVYSQDRLSAQWSCVETTLGRMASYAPSATLLILPDELQVNDHLWATVMKRAPPDSPYDRLLPNRRLRMLGESLGWEVVDPTERLRAEPQPTYFPWDSHPNPLGNQIIASVLWTQLTE